MACVNSHSKAFLTPPPSKKRNPKYYGIFAMTHCVKPPRLADPDLTTFDGVVKPKTTRKQDLFEVVIDGPQTTVLSPNTLQPRNLAPLFVLPDDSAPESNSDDEDPPVPRRRANRGGNKCGGGPPGGGPLALNANEHGYVRLTVRSLGFDDPGVEYYHALNQDFSFIFDDYALRCDYASCHLKFRYAEVELSRYQTPQDVGMGAEATAYVYGRVPNMNLNTHFKVFVIQETDDIPLELNFRVRVSVHMDRVYKSWAEHVGADDEKVVLLRKSRIKPRVGFVHESGICNGDRLFAMILELSP